MKIVRKGVIDLRLRELEQSLRIRTAEAEASEKASLLTTCVLSVVKY